jgi:FkbM family methyltransferase
MTRPIKDFDGCSMASAVAAALLRWRFVHRGLKTRYLDHPAELRALRSALSPADVVVDIGAHKGSYLWSLSRAVPAGRAVAFEPQPFLADYLLRACRSAGLMNVVIEAAGVSGHSGKLTLDVIDQGTQSHGASFERALAEQHDCRQIDVPVVSLDDYFSDEKAKIGAIKIDVEGHELSVLEGATGVIDACRPTIVCESEERHKHAGHVAAVLDFLGARNYHAYFLAGSRWRPVAEFDPRLHQRRDGERFWEAPGYYSNFLFVPEHDQPF